MRGALLAALLCGCRFTGTFECSTAEQCVGPGATAGACIAGSCAYVDGDCTAGYRFADSAADDLAGACLETVPPADCDAWMPRHFSACDVPTPIGPIRITAGAAYNTDTGEFAVPVPHSSRVIAQTTGAMVRVISVSSFTVDTGISLQVTGSLPLVIAAWDSITIAGRIDASSDRGGVPGAGANPTTCAAAMAGLAAIQAGSGGGGAGGFSGIGGSGGSGGGPMTVAGGMGGAVAMPMTLAATVRGGCPGAASGAAGPGAIAPATPASNGAGGAGGGALQLSARRMISVAGTLTVAGAGGTGGPFASSAGGGGGGSGGYLGLEAPMISVAGSLTANGGGGGGGASDMTGGGHGADGVGGATGAIGGGGGSVLVPGGPQCSGNGGNGSAGTTLAGGNANNNPRTCGGGGGGGGAGVIAVRSAGYVAAATANISPPIVIDPP